VPDDPGPEPSSPSSTTRIEFAWPYVRHRLERARSYWICTVRPDGRPHSAPVWGVWVDGRLWFGTSPDSVKARNLTANPRVSVHLESADDCMILEGTAALVRVADAPAEVAQRYAAKYMAPDGATVDLDAGGGAATLWAVAPERGHTWLEAAFLQTMTRWRFGAVGEDPAPEATTYG